MSKQHFITEVQRTGDVYLVALMAACAGVSITQVQLWMRSV